jgi:hypothetical protein
MKLDSMPGAVGGRRASAFRRSVLAETISQESTKLRTIITIHAVQAAETNQASGMVVTPVVKVNFLRCFRNQSAFRRLFVRGKRCRRPRTFHSGPNRHRLTH